MLGEGFEVEGVDHIGIVTDGREGLSFLLKDILGFSFSGAEKIEEQQTEVSLFEVGDKNSSTTALELLEPMNENSVIARYREKNKKGIHHVALRVKGIEAAIAELEKKGIKMIDSKPRIGHGGCKMAFVHPQATSGILLELVERT